ncbi:acetate/propionate family kinase [Pseudomonas sp. MWU13-2105]|uniref:acetate/propionate family kinase n=1 Tax=Pseudomonas sp. MWU13-2105 TaxID=2935074 RepID=UPI002010B77B|nr:acetate/propionate family kinase [Pseudomonas sp. MWU13-2105]
MADNPCPALLVFNAGSSTLKFSLYDANRSALNCLGHGSVEVRQNGASLSYQDSRPQARQQEQWPSADEGMDKATLSRLMGWIDSHTQWRIAAAAHRVVHGGNRPEVAARVDASLIREMQALTPMAPLHQPLCLAPMLHLADEYPDLPQVACFDTAFHHTLDPLETLYGLPRALSEEGMRRYGFHGLSYEYIAGVLPDYDPRAAQGRTIVAHLGNGASLCALHKRISRGTTMGFSTLDGLLMGSRPGSLDPGIVLYLLRERGMSVQAVEHLLYHECGLFGVSGGIASDMRTLLASRSDPARQAVALFVRRVVKEIGALVAVLGGIDALVFTGGIGEHAREVRDAILDGCAWLGLARKSAGGEEPDLAAAACLSRPGSKVSAWVMATDENAVIARHSLALLRQGV